MLLRDKDGISSDIPRIRKARYIKKIANSKKVKAIDIKLNFLLQIHNRTIA